MATKLPPPPQPILDKLGYLSRPIGNSADASAYFERARLRAPDEFVQMAGQDLAAAIHFLLDYNESPATFNAYRRDIERFLLWCWWIREASPFELRREDIIEFVRFCMAPPETWIGTKNAYRFLTVGDDRKPNPKWRPFMAKLPKARKRDDEKVQTTHYSMSQSGVTALFSVLSPFYKRSIHDQLADHNPVAAVAQKSRFVVIDKDPPVRRLSNLQWDYVLKSTDVLADGTPEIFERARFMLIMMVDCYLRISELLSTDKHVPRMSSFYLVAGEAWFFKVRGKGNKRRSVAVRESVLEALQRYRDFLGLAPALPTPDDRTPLFPKVRGGGPLSSRDGIRNAGWVRELIQRIFNHARMAMIADGHDETAIMGLDQATVHWFRHMGISEDARNNRPREHIRDDAGHSSLQTTDRYIEVDKLERHRSAQAGAGIKKR